LTTQTDTITVADAGLVQSVQVLLNLSAPAGGVDKLTATLQHVVNGSVAGSVVLFANPAGGAGPGGVNLRLRDDALLALGKDLGNTSGILSGDFKPLGTARLGDVLTRSSFLAGDWQLQIRNGSSAPVTLKSWSLDIERSPFPDPGGPLAQAPVVSPAFSALGPDVPPAGAPPAQEPGEARPQATGTPPAFLAGTRAADASAHLGAGAGPQRGGP